MEIILNILTLFLVILQSPGFILGINRIKPDLCRKPHIFANPALKAYIVLQNLLKAFYTFTHKIFCEIKVNIQSENQDSMNWEY